jgi:hypothetical protein
VVVLAKAVAAECEFVDEVDEAIVTKCSLYAQTELTALAALFGGMVTLL